MTLCKVPEKRQDMLAEFFENSDFTLEGIDLKASRKELENLEKFVREQGLFTEKQMVGYHFTGEFMNETFDLTDENAYPKDLVFLVIPNLHNPELKVASKARWFSDIVANNVIKQNAVFFGMEPDFDVE